MKGGKREGAGRKKGSGQAAHYRAMLETEQEVIVQYCAEKGLDTDEFKNKDDYLIVQLVPLKRN
jgi:hypothetical protein